MTVVEDRPLVVTSTRRRSPVAAWWSQTATMDGRARVQRDVIVPFLASVGAWATIACFALLDRLGVVRSGVDGSWVLVSTGVMCVMSAVALAVVVHVDNVAVRIMNGEDDPEAHARRVEAALRADRERIK